MFIQNETSGGGTGSGSGLAKIRVMTSCPAGLDFLDMFSSSLYIEETLNVPFESAGSSGIEVIVLIGFAEDGSDCAVKRFVPL